MELKRKDGFSLVELVVIVIVITVLLTLSIPQYLKTMERSRQSEAYTNLGVIRGAQLRYYAENSDYAYGSSWLVLDIEQPSGKFFSYALPVSSAVTDTSVARATREASVNNPGFEDYTIDMATDGTVTKTSASSPAREAP